MRSIGKRNQWGTINKLGISATLFFGAFSITLLAAASLAPTQDSSAAEISVTSDASGYFASISTLGSIGTELYPSYSGNAKITKDTVTVTTNSKNGYKLYISTPSSATGTALYNETDNTKSIPASAGTPTTPVKLAKDTWGYVPARTTSTGTAQTYTDADINETSGQAIIMGVPAYGSENVLYTNTTPTDTATNSLDVYYGVNVSSATKPGIYSNSVVYTAIVDAVNMDSEQASIAPASQEGLAGGTSVTISTGLYPGFNAANMGTITVTIGGETCTNVTPSVTAAGNLNVTCTAPAASTAGKKDVVVNVEKYGKTYTLTEGYEYVSTLPDFYNISTMQQMTSSVCNSVPTPSASATTSMTAENYDSNLLVANGSYVAQTTLYDVRGLDGTGTSANPVTSGANVKTYTVRKLADGNCWMSEDLKLGGDAAVTLTSSETDLAQGTTYTLPVEKTGTWCTTNSAACDNQSLWIKSGVPNGYLYNWYTATASTGTYSLGSGDATGSICPKGWKLPTGGPSGQYVALDIAYGGSGTNRYSPATQSEFLDVPLSFNYVGFREGGSTGYTGTHACYWSSTTNNANYAYFLDFPSTTGNFYPYDSYSKYRGYALRCLAASS